jgi:hypothetical protein
MKTRANANLALDRQCWSGHLHELDERGSALYSVIMQKGAGKRATKHRKFHIIEDIEKSREIVPTAVSNQGTMTINFATHGDVPFIKDDMFFCLETENRFRVVETVPQGVTNGIIRIAHIARPTAAGDQSWNTFESSNIPPEIVGNTLVKYATSKVEGSKDMDSFIDDPTDYTNTMTVFEDFVEVSTIRQQEEWEVDGYDHMSYENMKKLKKHKKDINNNLYVSKGMDMGTRQMSKGLMDFGINRVDGIAYNANGTLNFDEDAFDDLIFDTVKKYCNADEMVVMTNRLGLQWLGRIVKHSTRMTMEAFGNEGDKFGFSTRKFRHQYGLFDFIEDDSLNLLFPRKAVFFFLDIKKIGMRYLRNLDTAINMNVDVKAHNSTVNQIYTVGGGLYLPIPRNHTMLELSMPPRG